MNNMTLKFKIGKIAQSKQRLNKRKLSIKAHFPKNALHWISAQGVIKKIMNANFGLVCHPIVVHLAFCCFLRFFTSGCLHTIIYITCCKVTRVRGSLRNKVPRWTHPLTRAIFWRDHVQYRGKFIATSEGGSLENFEQSTRHLREKAQNWPFGGLEVVILNFSRNVRIHFWDLEPINKLNVLGYFSWSRVHYEYSLRHPIPYRVLLNTTIT